MCSAERARLCSGLARGRKKAGLWCVLLTSATFQEKQQCVQFSPTWPTVGSRTQRQLEHRSQRRSKQDGGPGARLQPHLDVVLGGSLPCLRLPQRPEPASPSAPTVRAFFKLWVSLYRHPRSENFRFARRRNEPAYNTFCGSSTLVAREGALVASAHLSKSTPLLSESFVAALSFNQGVKVIYHWFFEIYCPVSYEFARGIKCRLSILYVHSSLSRRFLFRWKLMQRFFTYLNWFDCGEVARFFELSLFALPSNLS